MPRAVGDEEAVSEWQIESDCSWLLPKLVARGEIGDRSEVCEKRKFEKRLFFGSGLFMAALWLRELM